MKRKGKVMGEKWCEVFLDVSQGLVDFWKGKRSPKSTSAQKRKGNGTEKGKGFKKARTTKKQEEENKQKAIQPTFFRSSLLLLRFKGRKLAKTLDIQNFCPQGAYTIHHNPLWVKEPNENEGVTRKNIQTTTK